MFVAWRCVARPSLAFSPCVVPSRSYSTVEDLRREYKRGRIDEGTYRRKMRELEAASQKKDASQVRGSRYSDVLNKELKALEAEMAKNKNQRDAKEIMSEIQKTAGAVREQQMKEKLEDPELQKRFRKIQR
eukprot:TRINITY_DN324_c0_g1_i1.p1 TRINITY_DN324_c0_g1~~TRINITY_DN324_c0_g1_i1.p1  ORF type:complete len:131 (+),score=26.35 TRINITY_DN324_c0_g1_i1:36-428(+)